VGKPTNRDKILAKGLRVVHQRGLAGASVRDIVEAAGVPQGSFSNHFASKEAFGVEILDLYFGFTRKVLAETLNNTDLQPLRRLEAYIDANQAFLEQRGVENGCLYGTYAAEITGHDEPIRCRLVEIFNIIQDSLEACLKAAVKAGDSQKVSSARRSATSSCRRCKEQFFFRRVSATRLPSRSSSESCSAASSADPSPNDLRRQPPISAERQAIDGGLPGA